MLRPSDERNPATEPSRQRKQQTQICKTGMSSANLSDQKKGLAVGAIGGQEGQGEGEGAVREVGRGGSPTPRWLWS